MTNTEPTTPPDQWDPPRRERPHRCTGPGGLTPEQLALADDRQPYPTAWAYEQACKAREKHRERADEAEAHRLALLTVLGLGTGAPWEAIQERAGELAASSDQAGGERLARVHEWVTGEVVTAKTEFGDGYRAAQRDIRELIKGRFDADAANELRRMADETPPAETPPAETHTCGNCEGIDPDTCLTNLDRPVPEARQETKPAHDEAPGQWCKCPSCWGWFVEDHPGEDLDELGRDLGWWSGLAEHRDAPAGVVAQPASEADGARIVAYRSPLPGALSVYCTNHTDELGTGFLPLTSDDLPDGGICVQCGVDLLIPQPKEA